MRYVIDPWVRLHQHASGSVRRFEDMYDSRLQTGIGTGWSTKIPNYNPRDVAENVRRLIKDEPLKKMTPWYRGFEGEITSLDSGTRIVVHGEISTLSNNRVQITELPIRTWTQTFKENVLEALLHGSDKVDMMLSNI